MTWYNERCNIENNIMDINLKNALRLFFSENSLSLESVYFEAITNAIDAGATDIYLDINISDLNKITKTLTITVTDNGSGFTDDSFRRFCTLLSPVDETHKGIGRLIYLEYFDQISIDSSFGNNRRTFLFNSNFNGLSSINEGYGVEKKVTKLEFTNYRKSKIADYSYIKPDNIKISMINHFLPTLFEYKSEGKELSINVSLTIPDGPSKHGLRNGSVRVTPNDIPDLESHTFSIPLNNMLPDERGSTKTDFLLHYMIKPNGYSNNSSISSFVAVDQRTIEMSWVNPDLLPKGFDFIILLESSYFNGKADSSRNKVNYANFADENIIKRHVLNELKNIIYGKYSFVEELYNLEKSKLERRYPHLMGYLNFNSIELNHDKVLDEAQQIFFQKQKKLLDKDGLLTEDEYSESLEVSSRLLMEYILYRQMTIDKLSDMTAKNDEKEIHNLIMPMKTETTNNKNYFRNNMWILDDKYMSFNHAFSDSYTEDIIKKITGGDIKEKTRPDIVLLFDNHGSTDTNDTPYNVVVIELKPKTLDLYRRLNVKDELLQRARALIDHCEYNIDRIWFYGIVEFDSKLRQSLTDNKYKSLFSHGDFYYQEFPLANKDGNSVIVHMNIISYDGLVKDAISRNSIFLEVLKQGLPKPEEK